MAIEFTTLVDDVMRRWPATIRVFLDYRMHCVGCPIACFHTVDDACREHNVDRESFLSDLRKVAAQGAEQELAGAAAR
jgi:hybrid cluster-associated redox disulfide protein